MGLPHKELTTFGLPSEAWLRSVSRTKKNFSARYLQSPCGLALVYHLVLRRYHLIFTGSNPDGAWSEIQHLTDGRSARPARRAAGASGRARRRRGRHLAGDCRRSAADLA